MIVLFSGLDSLILREAVICLGHEVHTLYFTYFLFFGTVTFRDLSGKVQVGNYIIKVGSPIDYD